VLGSRGASRQRSVLRQLLSPGPARAVSRQDRCLLRPDGHPSRAPLGVARPALRRARLVVAELVVGQRKSAAMSSDLSTSSRLCLLSRTPCVVTIVRIRALLVPVTRRKVSRFARSSSA